VAKISHVSTRLSTTTFQTQTIQGNGGLNVIQINGNIDLSGSSQLILKGSASDVFVINITGTLNISGTTAIPLSGGLTANHVLFNFTGSSGTINTGIKETFFGTFLAPTYTTSGDTNVVGEMIVVGSPVSVASGSKINAGSIVSNTATVSGNNVSSANASASVTIQPTTLANFSRVTPPSNIAQPTDGFGITISADTMLVHQAPMAFCPVQSRNATSVNTSADDHHPQARRKLSMPFSADAGMSWISLRSKPPAEGSQTAIPSEIWKNFSLMGTERRLSPFCLHHSPSPIFHCHRSCNLSPSA
jgi:hypothetical protein